MWTFKIKRFPDGRVNKYKSRLNAHGGMQIWGINFWVLGDACSGSQLDKCKVVG